MKIRRLDFEIPLCVALDGHDPSSLTELASAVAPHVGVLKVGLTSFAAGGVDLVGELAELRPVFLDLKLHDIPAQVEGAVREVVRSGAALTTVHAAGGADMIKAAVAAAGDDLAIVAVTVLTSLDTPALSRLGFGGDVGATVRTLAAVALDAGADGLVCSPLEVGDLRDRYGAAAQDGPLLVVPGIRPEGSGSEDQRRTLGPGDALAAGADLLVVGRPITSAPDPAAAAEQIAAELVVSSDRSP